MNLPTIWFVLIAALFVGYLFLEGFDYGVGILVPFVGRTDQERRAVLATIGPVWDANEVWLITAGATIFAAFPNWYATLFSGFYLALALLLVALIIRGVALEFRSKDDRAGWRRFWDWMIMGSSAVPALVWGIAMGNMLHGVPINRQMNFVGNFGSLINPYALVGGLASLLLFTLHGALYLTLKAPPELSERARKAAFRVGGLATVFYFLFVLMSYSYASLSHRLGVDPGPIPVMAGVSMLAIRLFLPQRQYGAAFAMTGLTIVLSVISVFLTLYPRVMISTLNPHWNLTIYNASSNLYSLQVMSIVATVLLPIVLAYQAWTYWVFRRRVSLKDTRHY
ncbi:cytochrome d ubiquinol oxidase, subunit II [Sulfobacillus acidophilus TPY]|uniref:Cytochrome bd quinol oxidase subunit 2 apoprotein n=1 Tax=Sulfobacillus acidophilus (strain ATCC 700253 / DSM 10332 / NAL) TaxID=679936 RepID=G8TWF9_SULAD|nr:cytochrome d ubiquinol oxidase, subunit II [Sulfobacillus acidophilus TPY]AEW04857.1 cytochrome bd quinol oxidase subunit 2 apoprotein [Sulfobacillus acidophilus DSM 10332]